MRKSIVAVCLACLLLVSCSKDSIKIGFSANMTDTGSELSTAALYGLQMAVKEINNNGGIDGRQLEIVIKDDGNTPSSALVADQQLADEGVVLIVGHMISALGELTIDYTNMTEMVMISPTISSSLYADQDDYFYTLYVVNEKQAVRIAQALVDHKIIKLGVIYDDSNRPFTYTLSERVIDDYMAKGIGSVSYYEGFAEGKVTLDQRIDELILKEVDAVLLAVTGFDAALALQRFEKEGFDVPVYLTSWGMSNDLLNGAGPAAEGVYTVTDFFPDDNNQAFKDFKELYTSVYGEDPTFASAHGYEVGLVVGEALRKAQSMSGEHIKAALDSLPVIHGLQGPITFDAQGDVDREIRLFVVEGGRFVTVEK